MVHSRLLRRERFDSVDPLATHPHIPPLQETLNFGVIYAYLTCHDYNKVRDPPPGLNCPVTQTLQLQEWQAKHGYFKRETLQDMLRRENFMWAIAIKAEFGLEKLDAQIVEWMNVHRTSADTWVLPPKVATYLRLVPVEKTHYDIAGPEGPNRVNNIVSPGRPHEANKPSSRTQDIVEPYAVFKKNNVFLSRSYHVDNTGPIDLMNRVSSVGEYFKMVRTGDDDCNVGAGYMTCWNNTRIYNEDEDTGFTVTLLEGLRNCMVFNDDGTPRQLEGLEDPIDARDLEQVFWLRSETDSSGRLLFKNIEIMGDIDPTFMPVESVAKLARTMINAAGQLSGQQEEEIRAIDRSLTAGAALVNRLANLPLGPNSGNLAAEAPWEERIAGMTTWEGINAIAAREGVAEGTIAAAFIAALDGIGASPLAALLGGSSNMFLNPNNALGDGRAPRVLYDNLFAAGLVPLVKASERLARVAPTRLAEAVENIRGGLEASGVATGVVAARVVESFGTTADARAEGQRTFLRLYAALGEAPTLENVNRMLTFIEQHPIVADVDGRSPQVIVAWARQTRQALGSTATQTEFAAGTQLAISRGHRQLAKGDLPKMFRPRGPLERVPEEADILVQSNIGSSVLDQMPIMQAVFAGQNRVGSKAGGAGPRGFDNLFAADDEDDFAEPAPVGSLFAGGAEGQEQIDDLRARRSRLPETGLDLSRGDPRLRFGVLSRNLEELSSFVGSGLERLVSTLYFTAPWRRQTLESWLSRNIMPNFGIIGFRVGLYDMALGIKVGFLRSIVSSA